MKQNGLRDKVLAWAQEPFLLYPFFAVLLLCVVWVWCYHLIDVEGAAAEKKVILSAREMVETYEAQMLRNLNNIEQALRTVKYAYEVGTTPMVLAALKERELLPSSMLFNIDIFDSAGYPVQSGSVHRPQPIGRQAYFRELRAAHLPDPLVHRGTRAQGQSMLFFSRRLNDAQGRFQGVVRIAVSPAYFTSGYELSRLGNQGVLGLLDRQGVFLARRTGELTEAGGQSRLAARGSQLEKPEIVLEKHEWDGIVRYACVRPLHGFPLSILVGLSKEEQFEEFRQLKSRYLYWSSLFSVFLLIVTAVLSRYAWQLSVSRRRTRKDQETYYAASKASMDAVMVLANQRDREGQIVDFVLESLNNQAIDFLRIPPDQWIGRTITEMLPVVRENGMFAALMRVAETGVIQEQEWENDLPIPRVSWLYRQMIRVEDGVVMILRDISDRKRVEARIVHMAHHDSLTGLPNRTLLEDRIHQALLHAQRNDDAVMVAFIDLDNFKFINDCLGHVVGDELLKVVAMRIRQSLRQSDTVLRLGGDEFVIVVSGPRENRDALAATFQKIRLAIAEPIHLSGNRIDVTASMGVAVYPDDGADSSTLLMRADATMYQAKAQGRNNCQFFTAELDKRIRERQALQDGLRLALAREELLLMYQPQVDLRSGHIVGLEALLRWRHPERGLISSSYFIDLLEETGLISQVGEWALKEACCQNKAWQAQGLKPITVSVNVSPRQFNDNSLFVQAEAALEKSGLAPRYLCLEITESMLMLSPQRAIATMDKLKEMGVALSIDDFGTGYSNLSALKSFPITRLKIDQSFVCGLPFNENDCAIAKTVISLGQQMKMHILAEGIETPEQLAFLKECGCDEGQGFLLYVPLLADAVPGLLRRAQDDSPG